MTCQYKLLVSSVILEMLELLYLEEVPIQWWPIIHSPANVLSIFIPYHMLCYCFHLKQVNSNVRETRLTKGRLTFPGESDIESTKLGEWQSDSQQQTQPFPPMSTLHIFPSDRMHIL